MAFNDSKLSPQEQAALGTDAFNNPQEQLAQAVVPVVQDTRTPEEIQADQQIEAMLNRASDVTTQVPMAPAAPAVPVPFATIDDFNAFQLEQAQDREAAAQVEYQKLQQQRNQQISSQAQEQRQEELAAQAGVERAEMAKAAQEQSRLDELDKKISENMSEQEEAAKGTLAGIFAGDSLGKKIGAAISVLAGGVSQGLLRTSQNPVLDFMEKIDSQLLKSKQIKATQLNSARKSILDKLELDLKKRKALIDDKKSQVDLDKTIAETQKIRADIDAKQRVAEGAKLGVAVKDINSLPQSAVKRGLAVRLPNGSYALAINKTAADQITKDSHEKIAAKELLDRVLKATESLKRLNPLSKEYAQTDSDIRQLLGKLRVPIAGPGVMSEPDKKLILETIGDATSAKNILSTFNDQTRSRLNSVKGNLDSSLRAIYFSGGIDLPSIENNSQESRLSMQGLRDADIQKAKELLSRYKRAGISVDNSVKEKLKNRNK